MNPLRRLRNTVVHGDCIKVMQGMESASVDFILTDPPYLVRYRDRSGRSIRNDCDDAWLKPALAEMHRVLKDDSFCISFYGWNAVDKFMSAWREAGFRAVGHIVFRKRYASSTRYTRSMHEQAYVLAKGRPVIPQNAPDDVQDWIYTGNRVHPTQKSSRMLQPLVEAFCPLDGLVLDPFCGSGSSLEAAAKVGREYLGIEIDRRFYDTARQGCLRRQSNLAFEKGDWLSL